LAVFESSGVRILVASGGIAHGDSERLRAYLGTAGRVDEVWLDSPGGNAAEGPRIGRVIRRARLATRIPAGFQRISSCTLAFLGGVVRRVDAGGAYGIHTFFYANSYKEVLSKLGNAPSGEEAVRQLRRYMHESEQSSAILAAEMQVYMQEMGISRNFLHKEMLRQKSIDVTTDVEILDMQKRGISMEQIAKSVQTYTCPTTAVLRSYNIINVD
jgi:hypothetical protein